MYGFVWMDFGLDILLRFAMLSYNCVEWGNNTLRLAALSPSVINLSLACCSLFWAMLVLGFVLLVKTPVWRSASGGPRVRRPGGASRRCSHRGGHIAHFLLRRRADLASVGADHPSALVANLYMVPAAIVWWDHFRQGMPWWRVGTTPMIVLLPAVVRSWRSPYRENLAPLLVIPLIAAIFAGRRPSLRKLLPAGLACFLVITSIIGVSRRLMWDHSAQNT